MDSNSGAAAPTTVHVSQLLRQVRELKARWLWLALHELDSFHLRIALRRLEHISRIEEVLELGQVPSLRVVLEVARA